MIEPKNARAVVHRSTSEARELGAEDFLDGEGVLPGFRCRLGDVLQ